MHLMGYDRRNHETNKGHGRRARANNMQREALRTLPHKLHRSVSATRPTKAQT